LFFHDDPSTSLSFVLNIYLLYNQQKDINK
jgi:hypothetical protein